MTRQRQRGASFLAFVILLSVAGFSAWLGLRSATPSASTALASWTLDSLTGYLINGHQTTTWQAPWLETGASGVYDNSADVGCLNALTPPTGLPMLSGTPNNNWRCIGRLPYRTLGLTLADATNNDISGAQAWVAVSTNLYQPNCDVSSLNGCLFPWLSVANASDSELTQRAAFIAIQPGTALPGQTREAASASPIHHYLDAYSPSLSNAALGTRFVSAAAHDNFNDRLSWLSIDQISSLATQRVQDALLAALAQFRAQYGSYPWLAPFADPTQSSHYRAVIGTRHGLLSYHSANLWFDTEMNLSSTGSPVYGFTGSTVTTADMNAQRNANSNVTQSRCQWRVQTGVSPLQRFVCIRTLTTGLPLSVVRREVSIDFQANATVSTANATQLTTRSASINWAASNYTVTDFDAANNITGRGTASGGSGALTVSDIRLLPVLPSAIANAYQNQVFAIVLAPAFTPGDPRQTCNAVNDCLRIQSNASDLSSLTQITALALRAGPALTTQNRATAPHDPAQYFESNNANLANLVFTRASSSATFNDIVRCLQMANGAYPSRKCTP